MSVILRPPWKGELTPRERFNRQMRFKPVDRSFHMEFGYWGENYTLWQAFAKNGITDEGKANRALSFDPIETVAGGWDSVWLAPYFESKEIARNGDKIIIQDHNGLTAEKFAGHSATIPHYTKSSITTPDDWLKVKKERFDPATPSRRPDVKKHAALHPPGRDYPLGIYAGSMIGNIRDMLTFEGLCYAYADYPEMLEDMVETCCILVENYLDAMLGYIDFDFASGWEDICFNYGPILPPKFFAEIIAPRYKRIAKKLTHHGIDLWYTDCDGDVRPLLQIFLDSGINCLFPYEVNSCAHPGEILDAYPGLRIMGGVDKMKMKEGGDAITKYLESLLPYVKRGGFIPFCDHRCPPDVTWENYMFYLDEKERLFGRL
jgi:uroporphyrinogen decarboxylase